MGTSQGPGLPGGGLIAGSGSQYYNRGITTTAHQASLVGHPGFQVGLPDLSDPDFINQTLVRDVDNLQDQVLNIDGSTQTAYFRYQRYFEVGESVKDYHAPIITIPPRCLIESVSLDIPEWSPTWQGLVESPFGDFLNDSPFALFRNTYPVQQAVGGEDFEHAPAAAGLVDDVLFWGWFGDYGDPGPESHFITPYYSDFETNIILWFTTHQQNGPYDEELELWLFHVGEFVDAGTRAMDISVNYVQVA